MRLAAIDIGTNTLLLLVAEVKNNKIDAVICDEHKIARLGEGLDKTGFISDIAINRATDILQSYKKLIKEHSVEDVIISATSAMRDAKNGSDVKLVLEKAIGYPINIIAGTEEAKTSFLGSLERLDLAKDIVLDIGGGSTEVVLGNKQEIILSKSMQIGAVRLTERYFPTQDSKSENFSKASEFIRSELTKLGELKFDGEMIAVAGTPTTIAAIDLGLPQYIAHLIHNHKVTKHKLETIVDIFINKTREELIDEYNVHPNRADVILGGAIILLEFLKYIKEPEFTVSCKGLRYGLLKDLIKNN